MKSVTTILVTIGFLVVLAQHFTDAKNSSACDFNMPNHLEVYKNLIKDMGKHRQLKGKRKIVVYFVFLTGQHLCNLPFSLQLLTFFHCNTRMFAAPSVQRARRYVAADMATGCSPFH